MATKFQDEVDRLLECSVCLEQFKEPKMLKCFHSFCLDPCLRNMAKHNPQTTARKKYSVECAICRVKSTVDDLSNFPNNLYLKDLIQIRKNQLEADEILNRSASADLELKLFVKITNDGEEPMTLLVKPSHSIEMIKTQIHSLREIPVTHQTLKLNGVELKNEDNLSQHQIENCIVWLSYKPWEISVNIFENSKTKKEMIKLEVDWTENISTIKAKIFDKKGIPEDWSQLYLGEGLWDEAVRLKNFETLADDKILEKAMKEGLSLKISGLITVYIDDVGSNAGLTNFKVEAFETLSEVKRRILYWTQSQTSKFFDSNVGIESTLYKRDDENQIFQKLDLDDITVYDYGIISFIKGQFVYTKNLDVLKYQIFVKPIMTEQITTPGITHAIECYSFDTIHMLKKRIQEKSGISSVQQRLRFCGRILVEDPGKTLKDYEIGNGSTLECREPERSSGVSPMQEVLARAYRELSAMAKIPRVPRVTAGRVTIVNGPKFRKNDR